MTHPDTTIEEVCAALTRQGWERRKARGLGLRYNQSGYVLDFLGDGAFVLVRDYYHRPDLALGYPEKAARKPR